MTENANEGFDRWYQARINHLPGETWPEAWIVQKAIEHDATGDALSVESERVAGILEYALQAGKHNEFYEVSQHVGLTQMQCLDRLAKVVATESKELSDIVDYVEKFLE